MLLNTDGIPLVLKTGRYGTGEQVRCNLGGYLTVLYNGQNRFGVRVTTFKVMHRLRADLHRVARPLFRPFKALQPFRAPVDIRKYLPGLFDGALDANSGRVLDLIHEQAHDQKCQGSGCNQTKARIYDLFHVQALHILIFMAAGWQPERYEFQMVQKDSMPVRRGRSTALNPPTRFDPIVYEMHPEEMESDELRQMRTTFFEDRSRSVLSRNDSPDLNFTWSINPYRGCEHGCIYCYARPSHEYLGWSAGLDFETKILVKRDAPELLAHALSKPSWQPSVVMLSGNTDAYQPVERHLNLSRGCLEVFLKYKNPVALITKNHLVTRDLDIIGPLAKQELTRVFISITTLNPEMARTMEPRTSMPERRLNAIKRLSDAGVPVGVMVAPLIPGLTDEELPTILEAAAEHGARHAGYIVLRLPGPVEPLFLDWLKRNYPERESKIVRRLTELRKGKLSDSRFGSRMRGEGVWAEMFGQIFETTCNKLGLNKSKSRLRTDLFIRHPDRKQLSLFG